MSRKSPFHHEVGQVIIDLEQIKPRNEDAKEQIRKLINYLTTIKIVFIIMVTVLAAIQLAAEELDQQTNLSAIPG